MRISSELFYNFQLQLAAWFALHLIHKPDFGNKLNISAMKFILFHFISIFAQDKQARHQTNV